MAKRRTLSSLTEAELSLPASEVRKLLAGPTTRRAPARKAASPRSVQINSEDQMIRAASPPARTAVPTGGRPAAGKATRSSSSAKMPALVRSKAGKVSLRGGTNPDKFRRDRKGRFA